MKHWSPGTVFTQNLRVFAKTIDFSKVNEGSDVYIVNFITSKKLDTGRKSVDWNWIICRQKKIGAPGNDYAFCKDEPDPDDPLNTLVTNKKNPLVLDGKITRFNGDKCCDSCFYDGTWMPDCFLSTQNPDKNKMFDNTISWTPAIGKNSANLSDRTEYWSYTFFMVGESEACINYNCSESAVFMNTKTHMNMPSLSAPDILVDLLPGTLFSYTVTTSSHKTELVAS